MSETHLSTESGSPACGGRGVVTSALSIVTCPVCLDTPRLAAVTRQRKIDAKESSAVRRIRADANAYMRRALDHIAKLPPVPADKGEFFPVVPMPDGGFSLTARGVRCGPKEDSDG